VIAAAGLLAYAVLLLAGGAPALARAAWPERAPRLAIAAWLALCASAIVSVALGGAALLVPAPGVSGGLAWLLAECEMALRAGYARPGGMVLAEAGGMLGISVSARTAWCAAASMAAAARVARAHRGRLRLAGRYDPRLRAVIVDHGESAAYCVPGPGHPVVLSTAALHVLDGEQLGAVLAHERAHQAGRHHLLVALAAVPALAFPGVPAFRHARDQVPRLTELAADDVAARRAPRLAVAGALLALSASPAGALGAGGSTAAARVRRLIAAPDPLSRPASAGGAAAVAAVAAMPLALLAIPLLAVCCIPCC
jgi:Zn-dependent protease with chaperone function